MFNEIVDVVIDKKCIMYIIALSISYGLNFRSATFFSKVFKIGFVGGPKVILWSQICRIFCHRKTEN